MVVSSVVLLVLVLCCVEGLGFFIIRFLMRACISKIPIQRFFGAAGRVHYRRYCGGLLGEESRRTFFFVFYDCRKVKKKRVQLPGARNRQRSCEELGCTATPSKKKQRVGGSLLAELLP